MPLYEYKCDKCDETFEVIKSASDKDEVLCPSCGEPAQKKLSSFSKGSTGSKGCSTGSRFGGG